MILLQFNFNCATQWHYGLLNLTSWGTSVTAGSWESCRPKALVLFYFLVSVMSVMKRESSSADKSSSFGLLDFFVRRIHQQFTREYFTTNDGCRHGCWPPHPPIGHGATPQTWAWIKLYSLFGWGWWYLVRAAGRLIFLEMGDLATKVFETPVQIRTMACKTHIQTHLLLFFFFLIENKDSDISTEPSQTPDSQAYWKLYGGRTTPKLTALRRGLKPFQHISFHNKPRFPGHNTSHIYIISSSTPFHYKCMCFWFKTIQGKKRKRKFVVRRHSTPLWPNLLQNEVLTSEQQHTLQYGTSIGEMT